MTRVTARVGVDHVSLPGGSWESAPYLKLGKHLLPKDGLPVTLEIWAEQEGIENWAHLIDIGSSIEDYLTLTWSRGSAVGTNRMTCISGSASRITRETASRTRPTMKCGSGTAF